VHIRRILGLTAVLGLAGALLPAQSSRPNAPAASGNIIRTETKLVLVDVVVTDKKGNYIRDLTANDFRVWEDKTEQTVRSFSHEGGGPAQTQYVLLFFDDTSMSLIDQKLARQAAAKFTAANFGPNRMFAVADYTGALKMTQNFTPDPELLSKALRDVKASMLSPASNAGSGGPAMDASSSGLGTGRGNPRGFGSGANGPTANTPDSDFAARNALLSLKILARNLVSIPVRKTLILFTGGLAISQDHMSELNATVNACNTANITVYTVDVRGIGRLAQVLPEHPAGVLASLRQKILAPVSLLNGNDVVFANSFQAPGGGGSSGGGASGGGGTGGGTGGGGATGGTTGGTSNPGTGTPGGSQTGRGSGGSFPGNNPFPNSTGRGPTNPLDPSANSDFTSIIQPNQEVAHLLVSGTGGLEVRNTNDLLAGIEKIGEEQNEYYLLGYTPPPSNDDSCHKLRVQVDRRGTQVRARPSYCNAKPRDVLSGTPIEKTLESRAAGAESGNIGASMQIPYFYTSSNMARVNVAMEIPSDSLQFQKQKGKLHAAIDILGIATTADGAIGARFSDTLKLDYDDQREVDNLKLKPLHYENQFDVASGAYTLKVVFSAGSDAFGKLEMPLVLDTYQTGEFNMSGIALSRESHPATDVRLDVDSLLIDDQTPLIANGKRIIPSGSNRFKNTDPVGFYFEVYEPLLAAAEPEKRPEVGVRIRTLESKTLQPQSDSGVMKLNTQTANASGMLPVSVTLRLTQTKTGSYLLEVQALDSAGNTVRRVTPFEVE